MSDNLLDAFSIQQLEQLRDKAEARKDWQRAEAVRSAINRRGHVQTDELSNCGQLFKHKHVDEETGRITHSWTGDNYAWMKFYMKPGVSGRIDNTLFTGRNSESGKALRAKREAALKAAGL